MGHSDRVNVFQKIGNGFVLLARYSENPEYNNSGKVIYPIEQGHIGQAWQRGRSFASRLPNPHDDWGNYLEEMEKVNLDEETVRDLNMKSRTYYALRLRDKANENPIGVLCFESLSTGKFNREMLETPYASLNREVAHIVDIRHDLGVDPGMAFQEGY